MKPDGISLARVLDHLTRAGCDPSQERSGLSADCPVCKGKRHLAPTSGESGPVVTCKAGCAPESIMEAIGLPVSKTARATRSKRPDTSPAAPPTDKPARQGRRLVVERASDVQPEAVRWLWPGRIALGKVTLLEGHPGLGKTFVALDIAARVSSGRPMPLQGASAAEGPRSVLVLSYEDDPKDTLRPRLDAAGADCKRILFVKGTGSASGNTDGPVVLPDDLDLLEAKVREVGADLVVVDPFMASLSGKIDAHRDQDVRRALSRMRDLAESTGAAFLLIRHLRKAPVSSAVLAGQGSIGIVGAARSVHLVAEDPNDPEARIFAPVKSNVGRPARALRFLLADRTTEGIGAPCIEWVGECDETADELTAARPEAEERGARTEAADFLKAELDAGPKPVKLLIDAAEAAGLSWRTVERAKEQAGVQVRKAGFSGAWEWALKTASAAKTANEEGLAALAKTATGPASQTPDSTTKTAKAPEDRQAASLADLGRVVESADLGQSQDLSESAEQSWVDDLEESDHGR